MVIFHSYVSLPEGSVWMAWPLTHWPIIGTTVFRWQSPMFATIRAILSVCTGSNTNYYIIINLLAPYRYSPVSNAFFLNMRSVHFVRQFQNRLRSLKFWTTPTESDNKSVFRGVSNCHGPQLKLCWDSNFGSRIPVLSSASRSHRAGGWNHGSKPSENILTPRDNLHTGGPKISASGFPKIYFNMFSQTHDELRITRAPWSPRAAKHVWSGSLTDIDIDNAWRDRRFC